MSCPFQQSAKQASYRDSISFPLDRAANRQARPSISSQKPSRPSNASLTFANSSSLHLLTTLEQNMCSILRILPRPYLFLKETLMREWVRLGGRMGASDARRVGGNATAGSDWGEKIERVWEFLVDSGGLRLPEDDDETSDSSEDDDDGMDVDESRSFDVPPNGVDHAGLPHANGAGEAMPVDETASTARALSVSP